MTIGEKIKRTRISLGKTQEDMANALGISQAAVSMIEQNRRKPSPTTIRDICKFLQIRPDDLELHAEMEIAILTNVVHGMSGDAIAKVSDYALMVKLWEKEKGIE